MSDTPWGTALVGTVLKVEMGADNKALRISRVDAADLPASLPATMLGLGDNLFQYSSDTIESAAKAADHVDATLAAAIRALG